MQAARLYVVDRGYVDYELFARILAAGSSLIGRVKDNIAYVVNHEHRWTTPHGLPGSFVTWSCPGWGHRITRII